MTTTLVFVQGWGFPSTFLEPLARALPGCSHVFMDPQSAGTAFTPSAGGRCIAIGHSMGALWLLKERPFACDGLVALNGFRRFPEAERWPGVPMRLVQRMRMQFGRAPERVWDDFQARCGLEEGARWPLGDVARMQEGLAYLESADARIMAAAFPILALAGRRDEIVPQGLSAASFGEAVQWHGDGTHALPFQHPEWCAERIRPFVQSLT